jgi:hypothetical protein
LSYIYIEINIMKNEKKNTENLNKNLDSFLGENNKPKKECTGEECLINDGKEIVERVNKVYKTNDGRQLLM